MSGDVENRVARLEEEAKNHLLPRVSDEELIAEVLRRGALRLVTDEQMLIELRRRGAEERERSR